MRRTILDRRVEEGKAKEREGRGGEGREEACHAKEYFS